MRVLKENSEYTQGNFGRYISMPYKVIAGTSLESDEYLDMFDDEDFDDDEFKTQHQKDIEDKLKELGYDLSFKPVVYKFDKENKLRIDDLEDAIQYLAIKDGYDLVEFENGNIGVVGYYNDYKNNAIEILRNATEDDLFAWENDYELERNTADYNFEKDRYEFIDSKDIRDSDGFWTEYSLYYDRKEDRYVCVFGDSDLYRPEDEDFDAEFETEREARDWFYNYKGFDEDDDEF